MNNLKNNSNSLEKVDFLFIASIIFQYLSNHLKRFNTISIEDFLKIENILLL